MTEPIRKEKYITVIGANFLDFVVWDLVKGSFLTYCNTNFSNKRFQTPMPEHSRAAAAIVLSVLGIEAYRNRVYCLEKREVRSSVSNSLCDMITEKSNNFPASKLKDLLKEVFVVRDVIVHNHIYEVTVAYQGFNMIGHRQRRLQGRTDEKYEKHVNKRTKKTKLLKLNVQPTKISFEDIFKVLVVVDLTIKIMQQVFGGGYVPFHVSRKIGDYDAKNLSEILTYYFDHIPRESFVTFLEKLSKQLRNDFMSFLPPYPISDCFINNICPECSKLGFDKLDNTHYCSKCGLSMGSIRDGVFGIDFAGKDVGD